MKKLSFVLLLLTATLFSAQAQKAHDVATTSDIFRVITYKYITLKNETKDATAVERFYTKVFKAYGYKHELPGDGYGGPCSIIDGFYKGGYINKKRANVFVPTRKNVASVIFISACNDGEDGDYGYPQVTLTVYSARLAKIIMGDIIDSGFEKFEYDNPDEVAGVELYYNGNQQVRCDYNEEEKAYNFYYSIAE